MMQRFFKQSTLATLLDSNPDSIDVWFDEVGDINGEPFILVERPFSLDKYADNKTYLSWDRIYITLYLKTTKKRNEYIDWLKTNFNIVCELSKQEDYYVARCETSLGIQWNE